MTELTSDKLASLFREHNVQNKDFIRWAQRETGIVLGTTSISGHKSGVSGRGMSDFARALYILYFKSLANVQRPATLLNGLDLRKK